MFLQTKSAYRLTLLALLAAATREPASAQASSSIAVMDRVAFQARLKAMGHKQLGGIDKAKSESNDPRFRALPHFSSSFSVGGVTYPYTMLGYPPSTGKTAILKSVIVPLRMNFVGFGPNGNVSVSFDPRDAVKNMVNSPVYAEAQFPNGFGQFGDMLQRATFWNKMDPQREWHVRMASPRILPTINIEVTPETGALTQVGNTFFGGVLIDFLDSQALTIIQLTSIDSDEVPIFVTENVSAEALGYHNAFSVPGDDGTETLQTMIYTSWFDPKLVDPLFADVSTFNHELGEWLNDPFVNNVVPQWAYPPPNDSRSVCAGNPFLEVGDPQGNGPTFDDFPTAMVTLGGVTYHLQQLVMLPWFADEKPSSAFNHWYTFPLGASLTVPAVYCK